MPQTRFAPIKPVQRLVQPRIRRARDGLFISIGPEASAWPTLASSRRHNAGRGTQALARCFASPPDASPSTAAVELVCEADCLAALEAVVDNGADCVHLDYNAALEGQSSCALMCDGIRYAHDRGRKLVLELNLQPGALAWKECCHAIDRAARAGVNAIISPDPALLLYASANHPGLRLQSRLTDAVPLSGATTVLHKRYGISRVVLPSVVSLRELEQISNASPVELEVIGFGAQSAIVEGRRCGPVASAQQNSPGAPAMMLGLGEDLRSVAVERCATIESPANESRYATPDSPDIGALSLLPRLKNFGVRAIRVEVQGGNPAKAAQITRVWRDAIDSCLEDPQRYAVKPAWIAQLSVSARQSGRCRS